jgi:hypothetical protein
VGKAVKVGALFADIDTAVKELLNQRERTRQINQDRREAYGRRGQVTATQD